MYSTDILLLKWQHKTGHLLLIGVGTGSNCRRQILPGVTYNLETLVPSIISLSMNFMSHVQ